jgi:hypothetical protein
MDRHLVVLAVVPALLLAGCLGGPAAPQPSDSPDVSPDDVPGVTNGTVSKATALVEANRQAVRTQGAILLINQSSGEMDIDARLVVGAGFSTSRLAASGTLRDDRSTAVDRWSNETTRFVRTTSDEETTYRALEGRAAHLSSLGSVREFLSTGDFAVEEITDQGQVVLVADSASPADRSISDPDRFDGRVVVAESGRLQTLSVTLRRDGETVSYRYRLHQAGVEAAAKPDWIADVPPGASVQARLSFDVENDSYLALDHAGGDDVPSETAVRVESNGTTGTVGLSESLSAGETRYLYLEAASGELAVSADRPAQRDVSPVTSPVSVRVVTDGGAVLHSASMGWGSATASGTGATDSDGASDTAGGTTATGSGSGSSETATTSP